jgi:hypothetical protein
MTWYIAHQPLRRRFTSPFPPVNWFLNSVVCVSHHALTLFLFLEMRRQLTERISSGPLNCWVLFQQLASKSLTLPPLSWLRCGHGLLFISSLTVSKIYETIFSVLIEGFRIFGLRKWVIHGTDNDRSKNGNGKTASQWFYWYTYTGVYLLVECRVSRVKCRGWG